MQDALMAEKSYGQPIINKINLISENINLLNGQFSKNAYLKSKKKNMVDLQKYNKVNKYQA